MDEIRPRSLFLNSKKGQENRGTGCLLPTDGWRNLRSRPYTSCQGPPCSGRRRYTNFVSRSPRFTSVEPLWISYSYADGYVSFERSCGRTVGSWVGTPCYSGPYTGGRGHVAHDWRNSFGNRSGSWTQTSKTTQLRSTPSSASRSDETSSTSSDRHLTRSTSGSWSLYRPS